MHRPGMTCRGNAEVGPTGSAGLNRWSAVEQQSLVVAGPVPAIRVFVITRKTWMPGTRPGMTNVEMTSPWSPQTLI
jgi:hypothetical protein